VRWICSSRDETTQRYANPSQTDENNDKGWYNQKIKTRESGKSIRPRKAMIDMRSQFEEDLRR
jgi:hypothetical protein